MEVSKQSSSIKEPSVIACLGEYNFNATQKIVMHAVALAEALHAPLTLLHVLDLPARTAEPADPVEWSIRRREAHSRIRRMLGERPPNLPKLEVRIAEGGPVDQICRSVRELEATITVVGTRAEENAGEWELGETARKLIDRCRGTLLLVPPTIGKVSDVCYRRLLVPLDGSRMAERVLPLATRLAQAAGAELLLAHVIPAPELTETGPLEANDYELRQAVGERNERVAQKYVAQVCRHLECSGVAARNLVVRNGDVRSALARLIEEERVDLTVMSSHGRSNRSDVACGSVAGYMITHMRTPLLLVLGAHKQHGNRIVKNQEKNDRQLRGPRS